MAHSTTQPAKKKNKMMGLVLVFLLIATVAVVLTSLDLGKMFGGSQPEPVAKRSDTEDIVPNLLSDDTWKSLLLYGDSIEPTNPGRNNPFLPY